MIRQHSIPSVGLLLAAALVAAPAVAKPPPAGVWIDMHFSGNGKTKTLVEQLQIARAELAASACADTRGIAASAAYYLKNDPAIAGMTFVGGNCEMGKDGQPKLAVGSWPGGFKPAIPMAAADQPAGRPGASTGPVDMVMHFVASNGTRVKVLIDHERGRPMFTMATCNVWVHQDFTALLAEMQASHERSVAAGNGEPYDVRTLKFEGADCAPRMG